MLKSDERIQSDVMDELEWEASVQHEHIGVAVNQGIVSLSGTVPSYIEKSAAEKAAQRVVGVKAVVEKIEVKLAGMYRRDDENVATSIVNQLNWSTQVPSDNIKVTVENGWVKLVGEVDWEYQKRAAEETIRSLQGVRGITNSISIKPKIKPLDVKDKIEKALKRAAEREAEKIVVEVKGDRVFLSGEVRSFAELRDARGAAWSAPGVVAVEDNLKIAI